MKNTGRNQISASSTLSFGAGVAFAGFTGIATSTLSTIITTIITPRG